MQHKFESITTLYRAKYTKMFQLLKVVEIKCLFQWTNLEELPKTSFNHNDIGNKQTKQLLCPKHLFYQSVHALKDNCYYR